MPDRRYDPNSGAVLFTQTPTERRQKDTESLVKHHQEELDELHRLVRPRKGGKFISEKDLKAVTDELSKLSGKVDSLSGQVYSLEERLSKLESGSHSPSLPTES